MALLCLKILLPLSLVTQSIVAQLPNLLRNNGYQNLPAPEIGQNCNQPLATNFPGATNIPLTNTLANVNVQKAQALQSALPKLQTINTQIGELLNLVSNINSRQLAGSGLAQNTPNSNNLQPQSCVNSLQSYLQQNNPYLPYSSCSNLLLNNVPNNNVMSTASKLPDYSPNQFQYNLPVNNNLPVQQLSKINSLTLVGQSFNNGQPFNVLPANALNNANNIPINNFVNYNEIESSSLKIPRSLPVNEVTENSYLTSNSIVENNGILPASWQSEAANYMASNIPQNNLGNGLIDSSNLPINQQVPQYISPTGNEVQGARFMAQNIPLNNVLCNGLTENSNLPINQALPQNFPPNANEIQTANFMANIAPQNNFISNDLIENAVLPTNHPVPDYFPSSDYIASKDSCIANLPLNNVKNMHQQPNLEPLINNYPTYNNEWHQQLIQNYQNNDMSMANWLGNNLGQPVGNNLPKFTKTMNLADFGSLPIFSGLPIIGITETVSLINPEQNQTPLVIY